MHENKQIPSLIIDDQGIVQGVNRALEDLFGISAQDMIGDSLLTYVFPAQSSPDDSVSELLINLDSTTRKVFNMGISPEMAMPASLIAEPEGRDGTRIIHCYPHDPDIMKPRSLMGRYLTEGHTQEVFSQCELGIGLYDMSGYLITFNDFAANVMGGIPSDFYGKHITDLFPKGMAESFIDRFKNAAESPGPHHYIDELVLNDEKRWFQSTYTKTEWRGREQPLLRIVSQDITRQKEMERQLVRDRDVFDSLQKFSRFGIWSWNINSSKSWWSEGMYSIHGRNPAEGIPSFDVLVGQIHEADRQSIVETFDQAIKSCGSFDIVFRFHRFNDDYIAHIRLFGKLDIVDGNKVFTGVSRDESEEIERIRALEYREVLLQTFADYTLDWEYLISPKNEILYMSPACEAITGYSRDTFNKNPQFIQDILVVEDLPIWNDHNKKRDDGDVMDTHPKIQVRIRRLDGQIRWIEHECRRISDSHGNELGIRGTIRDITEQKTYEKLLIKAKESAETARLAQERFMSNMSHEMRTPLNGIMGMLNLLLEESPREDQAENLYNALDASNRMLNIIETVLETSLIDHQRSTLQNTCFELITTIRDIVDNHQLAAQEKGLHLFFDTTLSVAQVTLDKEKTCRVMRNLLNNAIKFTEKGSIRVAIQAGESLEISVTDTGIGFEDHDLERVFSPFVQLENPYTKRFGGIGLGLYLAKSTCQLMGAELEVQSAPGRGSTFIVKIPETGPLVKNVDVEKTHQVSENGDNGE